MQAEIAQQYRIIKRPISPLIFRVGLLFVLLTLCTFLFAANTTDNSTESHNNFIINNLATSLVDDVFLVDVEQEFNLNTTVTEALDNGVPITLETEFSVYSESWYMTSTLLNLTQRYQVNYHALSQQYILTNLNTEKQSSYASLHKVLAALTQIKDLPLVDKNILPRSEELYIKVRNRLDISSLPLPLRATAYFSSSWRLKSDWATWILKE